MTLEILAPAGNAECAEAAINSGANAIYLGYSSFSARQAAENFGLEELNKTIQNAHFRGVKAYVAMNTAVKDGETEEFLRTLCSVWSLGADAIILQDALLGKAIKKDYPEIVLHLSTQAGVCTADGALFAKECGFSRVITARETPLHELQKIAQIIETEVFVQGALCTCFSGQCYFSSFAGGNSGNRGRCKQPCRKRYRYDRKGFEDFAYALSLSDLCVGEDIFKFIEAGVVSFKIEGRMRRKEYVAAAGRYYRSVLDGVGDRAQALSDLKRTYNRGNYTKGLAFGQDKRLLSTAVQGHIGEKVGVVKVVNGKYLVDSTFQPKEKDAFKILRDGKEVGGAGFLSKERHGFSLRSSLRLKNGDGVFVTTDTAVNERVLNGERKGQVEISLHFAENEYPKAECCGVCVQGDSPLQTAQSHALTEKELRDCFSKTDTLPVEVEFSEIKIKGNVFIAKSQLNALRRSLFSALAEKIGRNGNTAYELKPVEVPLFLGNNKKTVVMDSDFVGVETDIAVYKPSDFSKIPPASFTAGKFEKYLYYPAFLKISDLEAIERYIHAFDGVYAENYGGIAFAQKHGLKVFAGTGLNLCNRIAVGEFLKLPNAVYYAISKELNEREMQTLAGEKSFALAGGDIKLMDIIYCPFGKTCKACDRRDRYTLTDEENRAFPVRRYCGADGDCRFEIYNCLPLWNDGGINTGKIFDLSVSTDKKSVINAQVEKPSGKYTSGHAKRGVL